MDYNLSPNLFTKVIRISHIVHSLNDIARKVKERIAGKKPLLHQAEEVFDIKELCCRNSYVILVSA